VDAKASTELYKGGNYYIPKTAQTHPVTVTLCLLVFTFAIFAGISLTHSLMLVLPVCK